MGQYLVGKKEKKKRPKNARQRSITLVIAANAVLILLTMQLASVFFKKIKIKNTGIAETVAASEIRKIRPRTKERKGKQTTREEKGKKEKSKKKKKIKKGRKMKSKRRNE